jgi:hypothetical protein
MPKRKWRSFTWIIIGANVLLLVGIITLVVTAYQQPCNQYLYESVGNRHEWVAVCSARNDNAAAAIIAYVVFWALINVILFLVRYLTGKQRNTPAEFQGWEGQHVVGNHEGAAPPPPPEASDGGPWAVSSQREKEPD